MAASNSRTLRSIKNAEVSLIYYFLQLILGFFSRKAFFDYLGSEILGLNTTASNLLGFLNLAELGVSAAVGYFLYQPLYEKDHEKLNKLVTIQGWIYRKIAFLIIGFAIILMMFFPMIFSKSPLPIWYAYCTFGILLFSSMLGYFFNYKQIVLYADQKNYLIQRYSQGINILKTIIQILAISYSRFPFFSWLTIEFIGAIISTLLINYILKKEYPWLKTNIKEGKLYIKEYPEIIKKTGQAFFHRIGGVILNQSSPLILYAFTSLSTVALYGNYVLIVGKITTLLGTIFNSTSAAVGNIVASKDTSKIKQVFWELYDTRLYFTLIVLLSLYDLINPFISIWLSEKYCFTETFIILFLILNSISLTRTTVDNYINAFGLFKDIWSPLVEAALNIGLSILLGHYFEINGIIGGIILSQIFIVLIWKPYFLFTNGFHENPRTYFCATIYRYLICTVFFIATNYFFNNIFNEKVTGVQDFIIRSLIVTVACFISVTIIFYILFPGFRRFIQRIKWVIFKNKQNK